MKKILVLLVVALSLSFAAPAKAAGGLALLWVPQDDAPWQDLTAGLAAAAGAFKMTLSVSPLAVTKAERQKLQALVQSGRIDLPLRIMGDPVLPLLFAPSSPEVSWKGKEGQPLWSDRMDEAAARLYSAIDGYKKSYPVAPAGWTPAGGGVSPEFMPLASAYSLKWIATGALPGAGYTITLSSGIALVPFTMVSDTAALSALVSSAAVSATPVFVVLDETLLEDDEVQNLRAAFFALASDTAPAVNYLTVSQALAVAPSTAATSFPPPWCGDYSPWAATPRQLGALRNLGAARKAYAIYSQPKSDAAKQAEKDLAELDTGDRFLLLASTDTATADDTESEYKGMLENVYRVIDHPVPPSLMLPLSEAKISDDQPAQDQKTSASQTASAIITEGDHMLLLENPVKTLVLPATLKTAASDADPAKFFNTEAVVISWDDKAVTFRVKNSRADAAARAELLPRFLSDIYIDLNHRPFSGSINLLEYRQLRASAEDAWELALAVTARRARLFKATPQGAVLLGSYETQQSDGGDLLVSVPRSALPGSPQRWGYLVLSMALQVDKGADTPFKPMPLQENPVIDFMALDKIGNTFYFLRLPSKFH